MPSTEGARIEVSRGVGFGEGVSIHFLTYGSGLQLTIAVYRKKQRDGVPVRLEP